MENGRKIGIIPELQQQARNERRGMIIDGNTDPSLLEQLPDIHQGYIRNGGRVLIDYTGNVDLHKSIATQTSENK